MIIGSLKVVFLEKSPTGTLDQTADQNSTTDTNDVSSNQLKSLVQALRTRKIGTTSSNTLSYLKTTCSEHRVKLPERFLRYRG